MTIIDHALGKSEATTQYQKLIEALASVGVSTEVRNGEAHTLLIFTKLASKEHLYGEIYRSRYLMVGQCRSFSY